VGEKIYGIVDVGGTKILAVLMDDHSKILYRHRFPTPVSDDPEVLIGEINGALKEGMEKVGGAVEELSGLGICVAALVDHREGAAYEAPNLGWHRRVPLKEMLAKYYRCPILVENDANAAVVGEVKYGAAVGHDCVIYITISTGIGSGLYLDGKLYRGHTGFAGETGHMKAFGRGRKCGCGGSDCFESWASGEAVARSARLLWPKLQQKGIINTAWVFDQAEANNLLARKIVEKFIEDIGTGLANLVTLLNPSCLVIGGGVVARRPELLEQIRHKIFEQAVKPSVEETQLQILPARLEGDAGIWGMYALLRQGD